MSDPVDQHDRPGAATGAARGEAAVAAAAGPARRTAGILSTPAAKFFSIAVLVLLLVVPLIFAWVLVKDREQNRNVVLVTVADGWGGAQTIRGPYLVVPYLVRVEPEGADRTVRTRRLHAILLPDALDVAVEADTEVRQVSVHEAIVYGATVTAKGRFPQLTPEHFAAEAVEVLWNEAGLVVDVADLRGIEEASISTSLEAGADLALDAGGPTIAGSSVPGLVVDLAVPAAVAVAGLPDFSFELSLRFRGSGTLDIIPIARATTVELAADWPHPSFLGRILPSEHAIGADGFSATWRVPRFTRSLPQLFVAEDRVSDFRYSPEKVGVRLDDPVDVYALVERALKYGAMFVAAVFGIVFVLEILSTGGRIHPVQYLLVGMIVIFFYVLLLALAERITFGAAYLVAAGATSGVIATFVGLALESRARAVVAGLGLAALLGLLYAILAMEDFALLAGAVTGFVGLTAMLFATRKVNWSGRRTSAEAA